MFANHLPNFEAIAWYFLYKKRIYFFWNCDSLSPPVILYIVIVCDIINIRPMGITNLWSFLLLLHLKETSWLRFHIYTSEYFSFKKSRQEYCYPDDVDFLTRMILYVLTTFDVVKKIPGLFLKKDLFFWSLKNLRQKIYKSGVVSK